MEKTGEASRGMKEVQRREQRRTEERGDHRRAQQSRAEKRRDRGEQRERAEQRRAEQIRAENSVEDRRGRDEWTGKVRRGGETGQECRVQKRAAKEREEK